MLYQYIQTGKACQFGSKLKIKPHNYTYLCAAQSGPVQSVMAILGTTQLVSYSSIHIIIKRTIYYFVLKIKQEICLLGLVAKRWNSVVEAFISHVCDFVPVSAQFSKLYNLFQGNPNGNDPQDIIMGLKVSKSDYIEDISFVNSFFIPYPIFLIAYLDAVSNITIFLCDRKRIFLIM